MKRTLLTISLLFSTLLLHAQLENADLETWTGTEPGFVPQAWQMYSNNTMPLTPMAGWRSTDAHGGSYALQLNVWYYYTDTRAQQVAPINYRPVSFGGWYKYTENIIKNQTTNLVTDDTATASVYLTRWNTTTNRRDTAGSGTTMLLGSSVYRQFSCPITYRSSTILPDTVLVSLDPSLMSNGGTYFSENPDGVNSFLKVDDLFLQSSASLTELSPTGLMRLYPNPAQDYVSVALPDTWTGVVTIADLYGRVVTSENINNGVCRIATKNLTPGFYVLTVTNTDKPEIVKQTLIRE